ncbi:MAG: CotH kinase family protein [Bacteroidetes bacterium]|nr:CotH kinase family protein [Bacteroidota bacterium]
MQRGDLRSASVLAALVGLAVLLTAALPRSKAHSGRCDLEAPSIARDAEGRVRIEGPAGSTIHYTLDGTSPDAGSPVYAGPFVPEGSHAIERLIHTPTSVQWRHPIGDFPEALTVRACAVDAHGRSGALTERVFVPRGGALPVVALTLPPGALFDPDTGIYVVGHAIFHTDEEVVQRYPRSQKWWKYPGNFQFKGKRWQRQAHLDYFDRDGVPVFSSDCALRINGNNTRGFPQHALRVTLADDPVFDLFGDGGAKGPHALILRASGNDQDRTFFRDALQHRLCKDLPFGTAGYVPCVVYVNGAYWGLHNIRPRMNAKEIARRYGLRAKQVTILADRLELYDGDSAEVRRFGRFLTKAERWDASGPAFMDSLARSLDVDGFLTYIAAQVVLGNIDWPDQNVKWWRYTGPADTVGVRDGRWRFLMGDSDMGLGMATSPGYDMVKHLMRHASPTARLYKACMRSPELQARFADTLERLLKGPLSAGRMEAEARAMRDAIAAEMPRHIRRWRRPLTMETWQGHVDALFTFAHERGPQVAGEMHPSGGRRTSTPVPDR